MNIDVDATMYYTCPICLKPFGCTSYAGCVVNVVNNKKDCVSCPLYLDKDNLYNTYCSCTLDQIIIYVEALKQELLEKEVMLCRGTLKRRESEGRWVSKEQRRLKSDVKPELTLEFKSVKRKRHTES